MTQAESSKFLNTLLNNFQLNFGRLSDECKDKLKQNSASLWTRYCFDFLFCQLIVTVAVTAYWRGTWAYSLIYLDKSLLENVKSVYSF